MSDTHSKSHPTGARSVWPMFFGALVMIAIFWGAAWLLRSGPSGATDDLERAEVRRTNLEELTTADQEELENYGWIDREKGIVRLPIKQAMELQIAKLNEQEPRAAYPIATPVPVVPTPDAAPAAGETAPAVPAPEATTEATPAPASDTEPATPEEPATPPTPTPEPTAEPEAEPEAEPTAEPEAAPVVAPDSSESAESPDAQGEPTPTNEPS